MPAATAIKSGETDEKPAEAQAAPHVLNVVVIIVTYKSASLTIDALQSLRDERSERGLSLKAVVVDNNSGDLAAIAAAIESHNWLDWVTLVAAPKNGGFAYGNNLGIESAHLSSKPSYIYLLNPDTRVRPGAIGSLVRFLESHPEAGIAGSGLEDGTGHDWPIAFRFPSLMGELIQGINLGFVTRLLEPWATVRHMSRANDAADWVSGASMMIRPTVFESIGGLDENYFLFFEETDFCRRARTAGHSTWYVPESRVMHIGGQSTALTPNSRARLPAYWFESRRRYFAVTYGIPRAMIIDLVAIVAHSFGKAKRFVRGQQHGEMAHFLGDLLQHSILWKRNRNIPAFQSRIRGQRSH